MGPIFSVTNMRPSGRKAIRQGSSNVAVVVILKGSVASGFCSPTLTWAQAVAVRVRSNAALVDFIMIPRLFFAKGSPVFKGDGHQSTTILHPSLAAHSRTPRPATARLVLG